jgi:predicted transcriptional regulator
MYQKHQEKIKQLLERQEQLAQTATDQQPKELKDNFASWLIQLYVLPLASEVNSRDCCHTTDTTSEPIFLRHTLYTIINEQNSALQQAHQKLQQTIQDLSHQTGEAPSEEPEPSVWQSILNQEVQMGQAFRKHKRQPHKIWDKLFTKEIEQRRQASSASHQAT